MCVENRGSLENFYSLSCCFDKRFCLKTLKSADRLSELHLREDWKSCAEGFLDAAKYENRPANGLHYVCGILMVTYYCQKKIRFQTFFNMSKKGCLGNIVSASCI